LLNKKTTFKGDYHCVFQVFILAGKCPETHYWSKVTEREG
jgi:hypothetical protein